MTAAVLCPPLRQKLQDTHLGAESRLAEIWDREFLEQYGLPPRAGIQLRRSVTPAMAKIK